VVVVFVDVVTAVVNRNTAVAAGGRLDVVGLNDIPACAYPPKNALMLWVHLRSPVTVPEVAQLWVLWS
jgi:hypothetical protein